MKKAILLTAIALCAAFVSAQDINIPKAHTFSTEIQFNPFDQDGETFSLDGLKLRYFLTDNDALRFKLGFGVSHIKTNSDTQDKTEAFVLKNNLADLAIDLGYERHFNVHKRINLYTGGSLGFSRHFASTHVAFYNPDNEKVEGKLHNGAVTELTGEESFDNLLGNVSDRAYWGFNTSIFAGIDFYIYKGLFIGTELGIGLQTQATSQMKYEAFINGERKAKELTVDRSTSVEFKHYVEPTLRLGWTF